MDGASSLERWPAILLGRVLQRWHDPTLAVMVGLLLGSLRVLWPWRAGVGVISRHNEDTIDGTGLAWAPTADLWLPAVLAIAAAALVLVLSAMATASDSSRSRPGP